MSPTAPPPSTARTVDGQPASTVQRRRSAVGERDGEAARPSRPDLRPDVRHGTKPIAVAWGAAATRCASAVRRLRARARCAPPILRTTPRAPTSCSGCCQRERVREDVMQAKMSAALPKLSECYRSALRMAGAPVPGIRRDPHVDRRQGERHDLRERAETPAVHAVCAGGARRDEDAGLSALEPGPRARRSRSGSRYIRSVSFEEACALA